jgi:UDP-N-acetylglucosamine--N-acetylmuramyl-(pentapeptide) pyrophosphoryl-undecaprenol N-acetylglucosamine transferase
MVGNPVRAEIIAAGEPGREKKDSGMDILVLGGSQGAHRVNMLVVEAAGILAKDGEKIRFIHQTGAKDVEVVRRGYDEIGVRAEVKDFFQDMAGVYRKADLVISRAGATTLAELAVVGVPALLIPYPYAADDHQLTNGRYFEEGGGARVLTESELTGEKLAAEVRRLVGDRSGLGQMATQMKKLGRPEAAERIIDVCLQMIATKQSVKKA